jgi:hypothetical protein
MSATVERHRARPAPAEIVMRVARDLGPLHVGILGGLIALAVVLGRLHVAADGDISRFVVAGDAYVDPAVVEPEIYVYEDSFGYDGQFFWRLAIDPVNWELSRQHGVHFDNAYRPPRIVYPVVAWLAAAGQPGLVAWTMVGVNVVAVGVVAGLSALVAQHGSRPALSGLLIASTPGLVFALSRDLSDVVTLAAVLAGVVALLRRRPALATLAWTVAVLSREQALVVIAGYAIWRLVTVVRDGGVPSLVPAFLRRDQDDGRAPGGERPRLGVEDLPWLVPPVVFAVWQAVVWARIGELPLRAGGSNLTVPFGSLGPTLYDWLRGDMATWDDATPFQLGLAVVLVVLALLRGHSLLPPEDRWILVSLGLVVVATVSLAQPVWDGPADLRQVLDVFALSWVVLLLVPRRIPFVLVGLTAAVWLATVEPRVLWI